MADTKISAATATTPPLKDDSLPLARANDTTARRVTVGNLRGGVLNVMDYGATGDGSTNDTAALQSALDAAGAGVTVYFPRPSSEYLINDQLTVPAGVTLLGTGPQCKIRQSTWGQPVFDVLNVDDVTVDGFYLRHTGTRDASALTGTVRDGGAKNYAAGVWAAADRLTVRNLRVSGFTSAVRLTNWDDGAQAASGYAEGCLIENLYVESCDWGVVGKGWRHCTVRGVRGTVSASSGSSDPVHLLYVADGEASVNIKAHDCQAWDISGGAAYQFKGVSASHISGLSAYNCAGVFSIRDCQDTVFENCASHADLGNSANGSLYLQSEGTEQGLVFSNIRITMAAEVRAVRVTGTDCVFRDIYIEANRESAVDSADVNVIGATRALLDRFTIINKGSSGANGIQVDGTSAGVLIRDPRITGCKRGVQILANGSTGVVIDYDPSAIEPNTGLSSYRSVSVAQDVADTVVKRRHRMRAYSMTSSAAVATRADEETLAVVTVGDNSNFNVNAPIEPSLWADLTFDIYNNSGGAMGTITWNAVFDLAAAWANPANGDHKFITFRYDGTAWREVSRSAN